MSGARQSYGHARWCATLAGARREYDPWVVLVTGSRFGVPDELVADHLDGETVEHLEQGRLVVVRHGAARGVDAAAGAWARRAAADGWAVAEDPHPVTAQQWRTTGRSAGLLRNQRMVDARPRPDRCLAFLAPGGSRGTADCLARARAAGIETTEIWAPAGAGARGGGR